MVDQTILKRWMCENNGSILYDPMHNGIFSGYVTFTPERAESALENNTSNRRLGVNKQLYPLMNTIEKDLWDDNVAKINFDKDMVLSDGQHRLVACMRTGKSIRCLVTCGVSKTAQGVTDRRGARTLQQDLELLGYKNAVNLAAMIRCQYYKDFGYSVERILKRGQSLSAIPDKMLLDYFTTDKAREAEIIEKVRRVARIAASIKDLRISSEVLKALIPEFDAVSIEDANCFWDRLSTGLTIMENDAVVLLRKRFSSFAKNDSAKIPIIVQAALIIKAWNYFESGTPCGALKFVSGGAKPEQFPEIFNPYKEQGVC